MDNFNFDCDLNDVDLSRQDIINMLPTWKTKIMAVNKVGNNNSLLQIRFLISATTTDQIKLWVKEYENQTFCTYRIRNTITAKGRTISFKQILNCQHNCNYNSPDPTKRKTKNTNCPSTMTIKLFTVKQYYQRKDPKSVPEVDMPCEILMILTHNHRTDSGEVLRFRPVSDEVKSNLLELYENGHTPATALEVIKTDLMLKSNDYLNLFMDRRYCPDYSYCLNLFTRYKRKNGIKNIKFTRTRKTKDKIHKFKHDIQLCAQMLESENAVVNIENNNLITLNIEHNEQEEIEMDESVEKSVDTHILRFESDENIGQEVISIVENSNVTNVDENHDVMTVCNIEKGENLLKEITNKLKEFIQENPNEAVDCLENFNKRIRKVKTKLKLKHAIAKFGSELKFHSISSRKYRNIKSKKRRKDVPSDLIDNCDLLKILHNYAKNVE